MNEDRLSADEQTELVCLMLDGEEEGIIRLLRAYSGRVNWLLLSRYEGLLTEEDVEGIIHLSASKFWNSVHDYPDAGNLGGWFFTIARNTAIDVLRGLPDGKDRPIELVFEPEISPRIPACLDDDETLPPEIEMDLLDEIETLGEKQKLVIKADMAEGGEADAEWLAQQLGIPKQHVYSYRNKAHAALKKRMERRGYMSQAQKVNK
ncbi:MAG: sigma-70 family RNA polymerase sigma factor [Phycisphaerales bacterium]|nr:sigma-70 family RNA polymerase sigma factor [Phycisphaerales bacterium]